MKTLQGIVTSLKNTNTATVSVTRSWQHPLYKKYVKRSKKYSCHYEGMKLVVGQEVVIQETRPISKTKHFMVTSAGEIKVMVASNPAEEAAQLTQESEAAPAKVTAVAAEPTKAAAKPAAKSAAKSAAKTTKVAAKPKASTKGKK